MMKARYQRLSNAKETKIVISSHIKKETDRYGTFNFYFFWMKSSRYGVVKRKMEHKENISKNYSIQ